MRTGVLALQGDFAAHVAALPGAVEVRTSREVDSVDVLIIPGGESTAMLKLLEGSGIEESARRLLSRGGVIFGTCAGAILLAKKVLRPHQSSWELIDIDIERNAYGRQIDSFESLLEPPRYKGIFIRAPRIVRVGPDVEVLACHGEEPVFVREDRVFAATFHPELTTDRHVHEMVMAAAAA
jgi:5'-phosphate synthase pdxT subunit